MNDMTSSAHTRDDSHLSMCFKIKSNGLKDDFGLLRYKQTKTQKEEI